MDDLTGSMTAASAGMRAQSQRLRVIAENLANASSTGTEAGEDPYRRRVPVFSDYLDRDTGLNLVKMGKVATDMSEFSLKYDPHHPAADEKGYVKQSNVNGLIETMDMREAQRSYEANLGALDAARQMVGATLRIIE